MRPFFWQKLIISTLTFLIAHGISFVNPVTCSNTEPAKTLTLFIDFD